MATNKINLPPGYELDDPEINLPEGFELDSKSENQAIPLYKKAWAALAVPEKKSKEGLQMLAKLASPDTEVTGNRVRDIAVNTPRIAAETLSEVAPSFVSRGAILTAGGLKALKEASPALGAIRKGVFSTLEKSSGLAPRQAGVLEEAFQDPTLMFSKSKSAAGKFYEAAKSPEANIFEGISSNKKIVDKTIGYMAKGGKLHPSEALTARKAVDNLIDKKDTVQDVLIPLRKKLDVIAKSDQNISKADLITSRGIKGSELRNILPTNLKGTFSQMKTAGAGFLATLPGGKVISPILFSPAVQGSAATSLGAASKLISPIAKNVPAAIASVAVAKSAKDKKNNNQSSESSAPILREIFNTPMNIPNNKAVSIDHSIAQPPIDQTKQVSKLRKNITLDKAIEFLKKAKKQYRNLSDSEQREIARGMAKKEGWKID